MKKIRNEILGFIRQPSFTVPLLLTLLLGYGFAVTHFSVGIDTFARARYTSGLLFAQGRFSSSLISRFFRLQDADPFVINLLAVILLFFAAAVLCVVLKHASADRLQRPVYPIFACLFVSYPLINEIFIYLGANLNIALGYLLTAAALLVTERTLAATVRREKKKQAAGTVAAVLIWIFLMSLYESFAFVYVLCVCMVLTLNERYGRQGGEPDSAGSGRKPAAAVLWTKIAVYAFPLVCGILAEYALGKVLCAVFDFSAGSYAANGVTLPDGFSSGAAVSALYTLFRRCFLNAFWYLPVFLFAVCLLLSAVQCILLCIKKKTARYLLFYAGMYVSLFAIGLLRLGELKYRTAQTFAVFTSFTVLLLLQELLAGSGKPWLRAAALSLCGLLIFYQAIDLSRHFYDNHRRWEEERNVLVTVGNRLQSEYAGRLQSTPVIFIGEYRLSEGILDDKYVRADDPRYLRLKKAWALFGGDLSTSDYDETHVLGRAQFDNSSVITWGINSFDDGNTELLNIFRYLGFSFCQGTYEQYLEAASLAGTLPAYPEEGFISEQGDCIVVNFGGENAGEGAGTGE